MMSEGKRVAIGSQPIKVDCNVVTGVSITGILDTHMSANADNALEVLCNVQPIFSLNIYIVLAQILVFRQGHTILVHQSKYLLANQALLSDMLCSFLLRLGTIASLHLTAAQVTGCSSQNQPTVAAPRSNPWHTLSEEESSSAYTLLGRALNLTGDEGSRYTNQSFCLQQYRVLTYSVVTATCRPISILDLRYIHSQH
jgi:hypothetical protein